MTVKYLMEQLSHYNPEDGVSFFDIANNCECGIGDIVERTQQKMSGVSRRVIIYSTDAYEDYED